MKAPGIYETSDESEGTISSKTALRTSFAAQAYIIATTPGSNWLYGVAVQSRSTVAWRHHTMGLDFRIGSKAKYRTIIPRPRWLTYLLGFPNLGFPNRENLTRCSISGEAGSDESQSYDYRLDLTATALRAHRGARRTVRGCLRWYSTARTARRRRRPVAWTDRLCGTGCTVTTPKGWPDFVISSSRRAPDRSSRRGSRPN